MKHLRAVVYNEPKGMILTVREVEVKSFDDVKEMEKAEALLCKVIKSYGYPEGYVIKFELITPAPSGSWDR